MFDPPHVSTRIVAQAACFTVHPDGAAADGWDGTWLDIVIPADTKVGHRRWLQALGINRAQLFPDMDGLAAFLNGIDG